ncbi:MAG: capsule biosynthesis protein CapA [Candidatus Fluviicola riflensis]|nr:MAG: capsule biosynthesis protein CapA [Candidatus Fluviicola riflensis]
MSLYMKSSTRNAVMLCGLVVPAVAAFVYLKQPWLNEVRNGRAGFPPVEQTEDSLISLIAVGDMMLGTNYPSADLLPPNGQNILDSLKDVLRDADLTFGNLEGTVLNSGGDVKSCSDPSKCYAFRQPEYMVDHLKDAGFDMVSIANNHMGDFGEPGRTNTQKVLKAKGIKYAGLETCPWDTIHVKGLVIGLTAFAPNSGCLKLNEYERAKKIITELDAISDIVLVSFHGGAEGRSRTNVTRKTEEFVGENRGNVYEFAHMAVDAGADMVLGHGPHVTRAIDCYKGKFITYSMGNFATYARFSLSGVSGIAPVYKLYFKRNGDFVRGEIVSIRQLGEGGPTIDPNKQVLAEIRRLCKMDFPEIPWNITDDGKFEIKK